MWLSEVNPFQAEGSKVHRLQGERMLACWRNGKKMGVIVTA